MSRMNPPRFGPASVRFGVSSAASQRRGAASERDRVADQACFRCHRKRARSRHCRLDGAGDPGMTGPAATEPTPARH